MSEKKIQNKKYGNQKLSQFIETLHLDSETADVYFEIVGDDGTVERVPAHKNLLAAVSDVFKAMFYGQLKEEGDVKLTDVTAEAMKKFLQFFYFGRIELTKENIADVMYLGHKYNVTNCLSVCVRFLYDNLTNDIVCTGLGLALLYDQNELLKFCEKRIAVNTEAVFKSTDFLECDKLVLEHILKMNLLSCSETEVFAACLSWVKSKTGQNVTKEHVRKHLGDLFYEIRFSSMTAGDFIELSLLHDYVFSPDEYKDIIQTYRPSGTLPKLFNGNPRKIQWNKDAVIKCDRINPNGDSTRCRVPTDCTTTISSNEAVLLGGFICSKVSISRGFRFFDPSSDLPIDVEVFEAPDLLNADENSAKILSNFRGSLTSTTETSISFPEPILIRPGFFYKIHLKLSPDYSCDYKELMTEVNIANGLNNPKIILKFHEDLHIEDLHIVNLITALQFNRI